jgi:hypothetical protein
VVAKKEVKKIPKSPKELNKNAVPIYNELYQILIDEDRGADKFRFTVAVAANSLLYYKQAMDAIKITNLTPVADVGIAIRALNAASSEWARASKALLLTPEAEMKLQQMSSDNTDGATPPTLEEMMGEMMKNRGKKGNYGKRNEQKRKPLEKGAVTKRKAK